MVVAAAAAAAGGQWTCGGSYDCDLEIVDQVSEHIKYEQLFVVRNNVIKGLPSHHSRHHIRYTPTLPSCGTPHRSPPIN